MKHDYIKVPSIANMLTDEQINDIRVDRVDELNQSIHLLTKVSENVLITGDRGQGKTFLSRLIYNQIIAEHPSILPVRIDLTALHFSLDPLYLQMFPILILDQLCKTVWVNLFNKEYSKLISIHDELEGIKLFKKKSEKKIIEIYNILRKEEVKLMNDLHSSLGASIGVKGEIKTGERFEWKNRRLQNFEILELIKEIKNSIQKDFSKSRIVLICDEANKLTEEAQEIILNNYLDFLGSNQFNFLLIGSNYKNIKYNALRNNLFSVIELEGFQDIKYSIELIKKSFATSNIKIDNIVFENIYKKFNGHVRNTIDVFMRCISIMQERQITEINKDIADFASTELLNYIEECENIKE